MPQTVPEELLQEANAATALVNTMAEFAGPALATALVLGHRRGLGVRARRRDVPRLRRLPDPGAGRAGAARSGHGLGARPSCATGWAEFRARAWVWGTVAIFCFMLIFALRAVLRARPDRGRGRLRHRAGSTACWRPRSGAGTIAGAVVGLRWRPQRPLLAAFVDATSAGRRRSRVFAAGAPRGRCWSRCSCSPARACRCSTSGGRPRWRSGSRRTRSRRVSSLRLDGLARAAPARLPARRARSARRSGRRRGADRRRPSGWRSPRSASPSPTCGASGRCRRRGERRHCGGNRNFARTAGFPTAP